MMRLDARLPVRFGAFESREVGEAVLLDEAAVEGAAAEGPVAVFEAGVAVHGVDCSCCAGRSGAGAALGALFRARAVSRGVPFRGVLAVVGAAGEAAVRAALVEDPVASGRFRLVER